MSKTGTAWWQIPARDLGPDRNLPERKLKSGLADSKVEPVSKVTRRGPSVGPDWFSVSEAAQLLRMHRKTVERACRRGDLPAERRSRWRIARADLFNAMLDGFGRKNRSQGSQRAR